MRVNRLGGMSFVYPVVCADLSSRSVNKFMRAALRERGKKVKKDSEVE